MLIHIEERRDSAVTVHRLLSAHNSVTRSFAHPDNTNWLDSTVSTTRHAALLPLDASKSGSLSFSIRPVSRAIHRVRRGYGLAHLLVVKGAVLCSTHGGVLQTFLALHLHPSVLMSRSVLCRGWELREISWVNRAVVNQGCHLVCVSSSPLAL